MNAKQKMGIDQKTLAGLAAAAGLRLLIFTTFPGIPSALGEQVEISTPISSYKRLLEGQFLFERGASPYDGGVYHQAPLLLSLFGILPATAIFTAMDMLNAYNIGIIAERLSLPSPRFRKLKGGTFAIAYAFNPFTILACLGRSTNIFSNATILQAVASAICGNGFGAMFSLGLGTYLSLHPALILPPVIIMCLQSASRPLSVRNALPLLLIFAGATIGLVLTTTFLTGDLAEFLQSCYGAQITMTDLTPNVGLWWYFFIEIFDSFRDFFVGVFWLHLIGYVGALTARLPAQPLYVIIALTGLIAIFKPYPSISDMSLYLGVLPLYKHIMPCESGNVLAFL